ncbi:MAG: sn-glycerol-3-phosphate ABC transporter ATP-binding protein UgpC [Ilumatobacteraceae bacterium]|nr:sn-glycerol-3-phosphate ABC transporter ATP-binding protein UgpC [Ilumatobacter sp.]MCB0983254.1 sn-glycerol-3-phosphate ABC transporter ATP-binding protein UgpC [Ilumatobacter sp.]
MSTLSMLNLQKTYPNGFEAVPGLDLHIDDGEFLVLVGPSGCGKSTVLRMVAGLEDISGGDLLIDETRVNDMGPQQRDIAMVFQSYALYPNMTVAENIAFAMKLRKTDKETIKQKVAEVAELLELTAVLDRKPGQLSGGQRQRVAMGRAIVRQPKLFLMDEPLSNLDAKLRVQTRAEISKLQRRLGVTTMYVTHDQVEAMTMGDRVAVLRRGNLMQCASPSDLYENPENLFVAQFIGSPSMNVVKGKVVSGSAERIDIDIAGQRIVLDGAAAQRLGGLAGRPGADIAVGIRPEALGGDGEHTIEATVDLVEMLGSELLVHATVPAPAVRSTDTGVEIDETHESMLIASLDPRRRVHAGDRLSLNVDTLRLHAFDLETGAAIGRQ